MAKKVELDILDDYKELENGMIAKIEANSTASIAHKVGSYFYYQGYLYITTVDIAAGASIIPNTNCKKAVLGDDVTDLKESISEEVTVITNLKSQMVSPYKIANNYAVGTVIDLTPTSEGQTTCISYPCIKGDIFTLTGAGYSSIRLWAFTDTDRKLLSKAAANTTLTNQELTAEEDGYFIVNVNTNRTYNLTLTRNTIKVKGLDETNQVVDSLDTTLKKLFPFNSRFYKEFNWASCVPDEYVHVSDGDFDIFTSDTTAAQYYQLWNTLVEESAGYITATELGLASDGTTTMYSYDLKPISNYSGPKLFIVCGQHGFEKAAPFGLYYFVRELVNNYRDNEFLMYLRNWCRLIIIPLMNPYGFNNNSYLNANGVNLNRNWPSSEWRQGTEGTTNYGGPSAGSEVETQYAVSLFTSHSDSFLLTDLHTGGQVPVSSYTSVMWQAFESDIMEDAYSALCVEAAKKEINDLSSAFCIDYPNDCPTYTQCGHYTLDTAVGGLATVYAREHDMLAETVEGFPGWPGGSTYQPSCHQANADIFGNWFKCVLATYERLGGNKYNSQ